MGLADKVIVKLGGNRYVKEEEAVAPLSKMTFMSLLMLAVDEIVGIRSSTLPVSKIQIYSTMKVSVNMVLNISPLLY